MEQAIRALPHNAEAERALLGSCLLDGEAIHIALEQIRGEDFFREEHRLVFSCMQQLTAEGIPCDLVTVSDRLKAENNLERAGGLQYLASLTGVVPSAASAAYYARIVAEKALVRSLIQDMGKIREESYTGSANAEELLEMAEKAVFSLSQRRITRSFYPIGEVAVGVIEQIGQIKASQGVTGVPTFRDLDKYLSGLQKSDLIILAARPGVGKTSMALNIAQNAACKAGAVVALFSLEMPKEQLVQRMLCTAARVDQGKVRAGMASKGDLQRLSRELGPLSKAEIYIDDTPGINIIELRSKCRKLKLEKKALDLVVIDYLQLMQSAARRAENRQQEIAEISRSLKALAKELDVPVLALSQLSRSAERDKEQPSLIHLRESGALEQDADVVLFIHRKREEEELEGDGLMDVIIAKHRNGPTGTARMVFLSKFTSFENYAQDFIGDAPPEPA